MSYHIIDISTTGASLSVKDDQLVSKNPDGSVNKLPMEDIGSVLINCFSAEVHSSFLVSAAEHKVPVFLCDKFKPVSMVLPVQRSSDTLMTRAQIEAPQRLLRKLWQKTVDAKCENQYDFIAEIVKEDKRLEDLRVTKSRGDLTKEGNCDRLYWDLYSVALDINGFHRFRDDNGLNGLLNYGYAVLVLRVQQKLLSCGLDPLYGVGHFTKERSLPLSYDIMEPFRPIVDEMICSWVREKDKAGGEGLYEVDKDYKRYIQLLMERKVVYQKEELSLDAVLELVIKSFRRALISGKESEYRPWIRRNSKWVG